MTGVLALVFAGLAALLHVYIFVLESVRWDAAPDVEGVRHRRSARRRDHEADGLQPGFYNLFLAIGAAVGVVLWM